MGTAALRAELAGLPPIDPVGVRRQAAAVTGRTLTGSAAGWCLDLAIRLVDLTTLEGADTSARVRALCSQARRPDPDDPECPPVAAVCVYPALVPTAVAALADSPVKVASVATGFPAGQVSTEVKLADTGEAVAAGATEIDMVIDRGAFLSGRYERVQEEIAAVRQVCGDRAHLKVILETGELSTYQNIYRAAWLAMLAGADFVKTSTGKIQPAATAPVVLVMLTAVRDFAAATGRRVGVKAAGGIRTAADAMSYLVLVDDVLGAAWLTPEGFRLGASTLLSDLRKQRRRAAAGGEAA